MSRIVGTIDDNEENALHVERLLRYLDIQNHFFFPSVSISSALSVQEFIQSLHIQDLPHLNTGRTKELQELHHLSCLRGNWGH